MNPPPLLICSSDNLPLLEQTNSNWPAPSLYLGRMPFVLHQHSDVQGVMGCINVGLLVHTGVQVSEKGHFPTSTWQSALDADLFFKSPHSYKVLLLCHLSAVLQIPMSSNPMREEESI